MNKKKFTNPLTEGNVRNGKIKLSKTTGKPINKPKGPSCVHKWVHKDTICTKKFISGRYTEYKRVDLYYCEKCLRDKEVVKTDTMYDEVPNWWTSR